MTAIQKIDQEHVPTTVDAANIVQVIERAALNPAIDVQKMERLLAMHERILTRQAEQAFNMAMKAAKQEMPAVIRKAWNDQTKSAYAKLETISDVIDPIIHKHGLTTSFGMADSPLASHYRITCDVLHEEGHSKSYFADIPIDIAGLKGTQNKTQTHAFGSTVSYGRRYLKTLIFDVVIKNEDRDGNGVKDMITPEQEEHLQNLIMEVGGNTVHLFRHLGIERLGDLPATKFQQVVDFINKRRALKTQQSRGAGQ